MDFHLTEDQKQIQQWAAKLAEEKIAPHLPAHGEKLSEELLKSLSEEGLMVLTVPESLGGAELDAQSFSLVITEIAKKCASTSITLAVTNMIAERLAEQGNADIHEVFLKQLVDGRSLTASFCLTENGSGSDASAMTTTAQKEGAEYILNGEKIYITNGKWSNFFLVMAKTSEEEKAARGISAFLVSRDQPGVKLGAEEQKMGLEASSTITMSLENVRVPEKFRLAQEGDGFKIAMKALDGGRISVASQALGTAKTALQAGIKYANEREQFGQPISSFQALQWKFANTSTELAAAELLIRRAAFRKDRGLPFTREASMAKVFTTEAAIKLCDEMIQVHGGYGYIREYPAEKLYRDVRVTALYEGTSEIQRLVISRELLKDGLRLF